MPFLGESKMRTMLLSFKPRVYERIKSGEKKFEHRRTFPDEPIKAYMYVSAPVCAITGILYLGKRHKLCDWKNEFADDLDAVQRIETYMEKVNYAMEIESFQETTSISLDRLRKENKKFVCPQMYYYLDETPLLEYIEKNLDERGVALNHSFDVITSDMVCRH